MPLKIPCRKLQTYTIRGIRVLRVIALCTQASKTEVPSNGELLWRARRGIRDPEHGEESGTPYCISLHGVAWFYNHVTIGYATILLPGYLRHFNWKMEDGPWTGRSSCPLFVLSPVFLYLNHMTKISVHSWSFERPAFRASCCDFPH